jgi:hypothetical protein
MNNPGIRVLLAEKVIATKTQRHEEKQINHKFRR